VKHYSLLLVFCISLINVSFNIVSARASEESATKAIESQILEQLGDGYDLDSWEVVAVEETNKGQATIKKSTIRIKAVAKETRNKLEFQGFLIQMDIPGLPQQMPPKVVIVPGQLVGRSASSAPSDAQSAVQKTPKNQPPSHATAAIEPAPVATEPVPAEQGDFNALLAVYKDAGEVWGTNTARQQAGMPVILRNLNLTDDKTLAGTIYYPFQELANPFTMKSLGGMISMEVKAATPADQGTKRDTLSCRAQGEELIAESIRVSRSGMRLALTAEQNSKLKKQFEKQIYPFKAGVNAKNCFFIGGKILNVDTLEEVSPSWVRSDCAIRINNMPGRFISAELGAGRLCTLPAHQVKTVEPKGRKPIEPLSVYKENAWVSNDLSEYVVLKEGDVWHGKMDWKNNTIKQERNVTHLGMLNSLEPIAWYQNDFYFYNRSGTDKPILRINMKTGDIEEMEETKALQRASLVSPDGRFIFFSDGRGRYLPGTVESLLHVYDCKTRQTFTMDATIDEHRYTGKMKEYPQPVKIAPREWLSDSLFITNIGWYDLKKRERTLFIEKRGIIRDRPEHYYKVINYNFLPVPEYVDIIVQSYITKGKKEFNRRYLINRTTPDAIELPMEFARGRNGNSYITWIDENRYVFSKKRGSLKDIGTWLYDLRTNTHQRLTPLFSNEVVNAYNYCMMPVQKGCWSFPFYFYNQHLVFADKERIVFGVKKGNTSKLVSVPLNGGDIAEIDLDRRFQRMKRILPFSIELPIEN